MSEVEAPFTPESGVNESTATKRPVLPRSFLEANHDILGIESCARQTSHQSVEQFPFYFDAATNGPENLYQDEIRIPFCLQIRIARVKAEVVGIELDYPLKSVGLGHASRD